MGPEQSPESPQGKDTPHRMLLVQYFSLNQGGPQQTLGGIGFSSSLCCHSHRLPHLILPSFCPYLAQVRPCFSPTPKNLSCHVAGILTTRCSSPASCQQDKQVSPASVGVPCSTFATPSTGSRAGPLALHPIGLSSKTLSSLKPQEIPSGMYIRHAAA